MIAGSSIEARAHTTQDVFPASQYLQERLQERRAKGTSAKHSRQSDASPRTAVGRDDDIFLAEAEDSKHAESRMYASSPLRPFARYTTEATSANSNGPSTGRTRRACGAKEIDEQLDRLMKQNFDLKLELDHRRELTSKLQAQLATMRQTVEQAELLRDEHAELLRINSKVIEELERRDQALHEAVDLICSLEEKVDDLEERHSVTRPSTANADSGYAGTETHEQPSVLSPPVIAAMERNQQFASRHDSQPVPVSSRTLNKLVGEHSPSEANRRQPSFLNNQKPSTNALRSVYLDGGKELHHVKSFNSIVTKRASMIDEESLYGDVMNSPRLSILSESSFPSIYSPRIIGPEKHAWEPEDGQSSISQQPGSHLRQDSIDRVSLWMDDEASAHKTPSKSNNISTPLSQVTARAASPIRPRTQPIVQHFQSLDDTLTDVTQPHLEPAMHVHSRSRSKHQDDLKHHPRTPTNFNGATFGQPLLPPTPDTASTRMFRNSQSSLADERSLLDTTPVQIKSVQTLERSVRTAVHNSRDISPPQRQVGSHEISNGLGITGNALDDSDSESAFDGQSSTIRDFVVDHGDFPDGSSIANGTPSRFFNNGKSPATDMFFNLNNVSPPPRRDGLQRRVSSSEATNGTRRPSINRSETSPTFMTSLKSIVIRGPKSPSIDGVASPTQSYYSGSSSNRTAVHEHNIRTRSLSPETYRSQNSFDRYTNSSTQKARNIASPSSSSSNTTTTTTSFAQKTHNLLRRLSNSQPSDREKHARSHKHDRDLSPPALPTLTTTPSSAYLPLNSPRTMRRPSLTPLAPTEGLRPPPALQRSSSNHAASPKSRPTIQNRTHTEPRQGNVANEGASPAGVGRDGERRGLLRRGGSVRRAEVNKSER